MTIIIDGHGYYDYYFVAILCHVSSVVTGCQECMQVLQQRYTKVENERDQLYSKFDASIYSVQQKTGVRNLLREKKLTALGGVLEHKEAQLAEVMAASNLDPAALAQLNNGTMQD